MVGIFTSPKGGKLYGFSFFAASLAIGYYAYRKRHKGIINEETADLRQAGMGALL